MFVTQHNNDGGLMNETPIFTPKDTIEVPTACACYAIIIVFVVNKGLATQQRKTDSESGYLVTPTGVDGRAILGLRSAFGRAPVWGLQDTNGSIMY